MPILIRPYTENFVPAVKRFNQRLQEGQSFSDILFFEDPIPESLPQLDGRKIYEQYFVAVDDREVRGGFALKHQDFWFRGQMKPGAFYHYPLSEGIIDKKYVNVGAMMLRNALQVHPLMFALGMGGFDWPLPRMLKALGWKMALVPFYFRVLHPFRFLRRMPEIRKSRLRRVAADLGAFTGLGTLAILGYQRLRARSTSSFDSVTFEEVPEFGEWADATWQECRDQYAMIGNRSGSALNTLYPPGNQRFMRLKIEFRGSVLGWVVLLDTQMHEDQPHENLRVVNRHFGNLRVGSIVDCLAAPGHAHAVILSATRFLRSRKVDLIISNQSHSAWISALKKSGFIEGPSNCVFAAAPAMSELLQPFNDTLLQVHLNRGDGDGPIRL